MPYYASPGSVTTVSGSYQSAQAIWVPALGLTSIAQRRIKVYEILAGAIGNPNSNDTYLECAVMRQTASGSGAGTGVTNNPLDTADPVSCTTGLVSPSAETTFSGTVTLWDIGMNQRATVRWIAAQESQYFVSPFTSGLGFALRTKSANYTSAFDGQLSFME